MSDTISRAKAIEALMGAMNDVGALDAEDINTVFQMLPSAQPAIVPCDYAKACNKVAMNRITSAVVYMEILEDFKEYGYVLVDMSENMPLENNSEIPNSSDTISRADVEQTIEDNILCYTHSDRPIDQDHDTECHMAIRTAFRMLRKDLRKLPPAQPERIKSKWALHTYMPHNKFCLACRNDSPYNKRWDFCPNCGAEMEVTT